MVSGEVPELGAASVLANISPCMVSASALDLGSHLVLEQALAHRIACVNRGGSCLGVIEAFAVGHDHVEFAIADTLSKADWNLG